jgi:hypothetical protein
MLIMLSTSTNTLRDVMLLFLIVSAEASITIHFVSLLAGALVTIPEPMLGIVRLKHLANPELI